jgi:hypothetical protein
VYRVMFRYIVARFRHGLERKHKWKIMGCKSYPDECIYEKYRLIDLFELVPKYSSCEIKKSQ